MKETYGSRFRKWYIDGAALPEGKEGRKRLAFMNLVHAPFHRWVMKRGEFSDEMSLLDIGTGGGGFPAKLQRFYPFADIDCCDVSKTAVEYTARKVEGRIFLSPAERIDALDSAYTTVTALDTVYYWEDLDKAFSEVFRVLKGGGVFLMGIEMADPDLTPDWQADNPRLRVRTKEELKERLLKQGFSEVKAVGKKGTWLLLQARKTG